MNKILISVAALALAAAATVSAGAATPVEKHGQLRVEGTQLVDAQGQPVQLRGVSMGWHNMWPRFYNGGTVDRLTGDWGADIVRCSGKLPNVMYEIWNEPTEVPWSECKAYAEELVPVIRALAPEAVVVVPTPRWDQEVDKAAEDQIKGIDNLLYSLHYYATTHTQWLRDKADYARSLGLPLIMSECASMEHTGDGVINPKEWDEWMQYADRNGISWIAWSISDKDETCSMLRPSAASDGRQWKDSDLKPWAVLVKHYLKRNR